MADTEQSALENDRRKLAPIALGVVPSEGSHPARGLPAILGLALLGMAGTVAWMTTPGFTDRVGDLADRPQWVTWIVVLAIQAAVFLGVLPAVWIETRRSKLKFRGTPLATLVVLLALLMLLPIAATVLVDPAHPVQDVLRRRIWPISVAGNIVAALAAAGIVRTHKEIEEAAPTADASDPDEDVASFSELRRRLRLLGGLLAVLVALAVFGAGAQRNAIVAMEVANAADATARANEVEAAAANARAERFGIELVWSYGLYYSFALVLVYMPPYLSLMALGRAIRDKHTPPVAPNDPAYEGGKKVRDAWDEVLQLKTTTAESLRAATLVLVPLITSLGSTLLGGVKVGE
jgi:hypothetical protein